MVNANTKEEALQKSIPLFTARLIKTAKSKSDEWSFSGIASDESTDVEDDTILKKCIDISYAQKRGYVNWDHSRAPEDQIGFLTKIELVNAADIPALSKSLDVELPPTSSVYVEGRLYEYVERAIATQKLLKSVPDDLDVMTGPALSLDGSMVKEKESGSVVRAFVRGVALTTVPANINTLARMKKSLLDYSMSPSEEESPVATLLTELRSEVGQTRQMVSDLLAKSVSSKSGLTEDEAVLWVLRKNPGWTYELASKVVRFTIEHSKIKE